MRKGDKGWGIWGAIVVLMVIGSVFCGLMATASAIDYKNIVLESGTVFKCQNCVSYKVVTDPWNYPDTTALCYVQPGQRYAWTGDNYGGWRKIWIAPYSNGYKGTTGWIYEGTYWAKETATVVRAKTTGAVYKSPGSGLYGYIYSGQKFYYLGSSGDWFKIQMCGDTAGGGAMQGWVDSGGSAVQPPTAPTLVNVIGTSNNVLLQWNDNSNNEDGFKIERKEGTSGTYTQIGTTGANVNIYADSGLQFGKVYCYRVRAYNSAGNSDYSNEKCATTLSTPALSSPSNGATLNTNTVTLKWNCVTGANGYGVNVSKISCGGSDIFGGVTTSCEKGISNIANGIYYWQVRAFATTYPGLSQYSDCRSFTIDVPPVQPPTAPTLVNVIGTSNNILLQWNDNSNNEDGFKIERKDGTSGTYTQIGTTGANVNVYADSGLQFGKVYCYRVRAYNSAGNSDYSNEKCATTLSTPALSSPSNGATLNTNTVTLKWNCVTGADGYGVNVSKISCGGSDIFGGVTTSCEKVISNLANGIYYWQVRAFSTTYPGLSQHSDCWSFTIDVPQVPPPTAPTLIKIVGTSNNVLFQWNDNSNNEDGFKIERKDGTSGTYTQIGTTGANVNVYADSGLQFGKVYCYRVRAYNSAGNSGYSNEKCATTLSKPTLSSPFNGATLNTNTVTLKWSCVTGADGYGVNVSKISCGGSDIFGGATTSCEKVISNLANGVYYWQVRAFSTTYPGLSQHSDCWSFTIGVPADVTLTLYVHDGSATGPLLSGVRVIGYDAGGTSFDKTTGTGGYVTITGAPGTWHFNISKSGYKPVEWDQSITTTCERHAYFSEKEVPKPLITSPLVITRKEVTPSFCSNTVGGPCFLDIPTLPYFVGDTLTATFTITNKGTASITFDKLTVGGRFNDGKLPNGEYPDFTHLGPITLKPQQSYHYEGTLQLTHAGDYHFFCAYQTPDGKWDTSIDLGEGLTDEDRTEDIEVKYRPSLHPSSSPILEIANLNDNDRKQVHNIIRQVLDIDQARSKLIGEQDEILLEDVNLLLNQIHPDPEKHVAGLEVHDIVKELPEDQELAIDFIGAGAGQVFIRIGLLTGQGWIYLVGQYFPVLTEGAKMLGLEIGEKMVLKDIGSATVRYPGVGRMEVVWLRPPKDKIIVNIYLKKSEKKGSIIVSAGEYQKELQMRWGLNAQSTVPVWNAFTYPPQNTLTDPESIIKHVQIIGLHSPGEIRVYDSHERVTGIVDGKVKEEILGSIYDNETKTVIVFSPSDSYRYEVVGTDNGTYGLAVTSVENEEPNTFAVTDVSTTNKTTHQYTINWSTQEVTVQTDSDGDGTFEQNITLQPPVASFTYTPENPTVNQAITFNASSSYDPDGNITNYEWNFGDGTNGSGRITTHSYSSAGEYPVTLIITDNSSTLNSTTKIILVLELEEFIFDTGPGTYPSIFGTHNGTIKPNQTITVSKLYTYPCAGTGGHTEYARIWNNSGLSATANWSGYTGDWHTITFNKTFLLYKNKTYNYTIHTSSYPLIIHAKSKDAIAGAGTITCDKFIDANGKEYTDWIPAIKLFH